MRYKTFYKVRALDNLQLAIDEVHHTYYMANTSMLSYLERGYVAWVEEEIKVYEAGCGWKTTEAII